MFPLDAAVRRVNREGILLLGGGRALLMQLAHPAVAQGVADHSDFGAAPFDRLARTLDASYTMVFGTEQEAEETAAVIRAVHDRITGPGYRANDPDLLLWVHATLVDTAWRMYRRFVGPLDLPRYYEESKRIAALLGVPMDRQPSDVGHFRAYVRHMVGTLTVTAPARRLAHEVLHASLPGLAGPLSLPVMGVFRQVTVGLLPPPLRAGFGLGWDPGRQAAFDAMTVVLRQLVPRLPPGWRQVSTPSLRLAS